MWLGSDNLCALDLQIQILSRSIQCIFFSWHNYKFNVISTLKPNVYLGTAFISHLLLSRKAHPHHIAPVCKILLSQCLWCAMWAVLKTEQGVAAAGCSDSKLYSIPFQGHFFSGCCVAIRHLLQLGFIQPSLFHTEKEVSRSKIWQKFSLAWCHVYKWVGMHWFQTLMTKVFIHIGILKNLVL